MNFTSFSNALALMEAIVEKFRELSAAYIFKGSVPFSGLPAVLDSGMTGYTYNVTDEFTTDARFIEGAGKKYAAGTNVVVADVSYTTYQEVTPEGTEDPAELGWYELISDEYVATEDTEVQPGKTYYEQVTVPSFKFDVLASFVDVDAIMQAINGKVDKVEGKGLSTNDYTNADKTRLTDCKTIYECTRNEYEGLTSDDYDWYAVIEVVS